MRHLFGDEDLRLDRSYFGKLLCHVDRLVEPARRSVAELGEENPEWDRRTLSEALTRRACLDLSEEALEPCVDLPDLGFELAWEGPLGRFYTLAARLFQLVLEQAHVWGHDLDDPMRATEIVVLVDLATRREGEGTLRAGSVRERIDEILDEAFGPERALDLVKAVGLRLYGRDIAKYVPFIGPLTLGGFNYFLTWTVGELAAAWYDDGRVTEEEVRRIVEGGQTLKLALMTAMINVARSDRVVAEEEIELVNLHLRELGFDEEQRRVALRALEDPCGLDEEVLSLVRHPADREYVLRRALELAHADGKFVATESRELSRLAELFGMDGEELARLDRQVRLSLGDA